MATKRMFSLQIVDTDAFLDMSKSSQLLYFHLAMRADDEGFVSSPKKIMKMVSCAPEDYSELVENKFIIPFQSGVCVIKHWLIHNIIRMDRFNKTTYQREKSQLKLKDNNAYTLRQASEEEMATKWQPNGNQMVPQVKLSKVKLVDMSEKSDAFDQFWNAYPKKELKKKACAIWKRKGCDKFIVEILAFIDAAKKTDRWRKGFIKQPTAFLNGECWNDDLSSYGDIKKTPETPKIQEFKREEVIITEEQRKENIKKLKEIRGKLFDKNKNK